METQEIVISDFSKGMIEIIELGVSADKNYAAPSVKYLENLNPNILQGALLKRRSVSTFDLATDSLYGKSSYNPFGDASFLDFGGKRYCGVYGTHKWQLMPNGDYVEADTGAVLTSDQVKYWNASFRQLKGPDVFLGMDRFDMRNPVPSSIYFAIIRDDQKIGEQWIKSSSINGYYYSKSLQDSYPLPILEGMDWWNPLYDSATENFNTYPSTKIPFAIKGGRINGIVQDWVVVGQAVYFVSMPDILNERLPAFPVYRWYPITDAVMPGIPKIFTTDVNLRSYYLLGVAGDLNAKSSCILTPYYRGDVTRHPQYKGNSQTSFDETVQNKIESIDWDGLKNSIDVLWWQTDKFPTMQGITGESFHGTVTSNRAKGAQRSYKQTPLADRTFGGNTYLKDELNPNKLIIRPRLIENGKSGWMSWRTERKEDLEFQITDEPINVFTTTLPYVPDDKDPYAIVQHERSSGKQRTPDGTQVRLKNGNSQNFAPSDLPTNFLALDYRFAESPRPWHPGEKIPYCLTAVVEGVEFIVLQDTYVVAEGLANGVLNDNYKKVELIYGGFKRLGTITWCKQPLSYAETLETFAPASGDEDRYRTNVATASPMFVGFTLRINVPIPSLITDYLPPNLTSFKLYVSIPDYVSSVFYDDNNPFDDKSYRHPYVLDENSRAYALVKEFLMTENQQLQYEGNSDYFGSFVHGSQGTKSLAQGKWIRLLNEEPQFAQADGPQLLYNGGTGYYYVPYLANAFSLNPTPDFYLWDYPEGVDLAGNVGLLSSRWDGIGARCITQVSNRVVIGGTIDKDRQEEVGRIRASAVQGVTFSNTLFAELDALDIASTPIEALANFRNDLWVFSHNSIVRVAPTNPYDMTTWQIVDTITGQGILSRKHLVQTPMGLFFANSSGVWFVDGSKMENIVLPVQQTFKFIFNQTADWQAYHRYSIDMWRPSDSTLHRTYNDTFELNYNSEHNELVMSVRVSRPSGGIAGVPGAFAELSLIYNIDAENFRIEVVDLPVSNLDNTYTHSSHNKAKFLDHDGKLASPLVMDRTRLYWRKGSFGQYDEHYLSYIYDHCDFTNEPQLDMLLRGKNRIQRMWYPGITTFYEVGNGLDDSLLRQVLVELTPMEFETGFTNQGPVPQITWRDPKLYIQYRNKESKLGDQPQILQAVPFPTLAGLYDLVELNTRNVPIKDIFWSHINTPIARVWSRESMVLNTPLDAKFRRLEATLVTTSLSYLKSLRFKFSTFKRKTLG